MVRFSMQAASMQSFEVPQEPYRASAPPLKRSRYSSTEDVSTSMDSGSFLATFDVDTLDCSVCMEHLRPPVYQCGNGHIVCHSCRTKMPDVCPSCSTTMGKIRCLAIEKLIESLFVSCKYASHGCRQMIKFTQKSVHENGCSFEPFHCPISHCDYSAPASNLPEHFLESHHIPTFEFKCEARFSLQLAPDDHYALLKLENILLLLHRDKDVLGNLIYLTYFGLSLQGDFSYHIEVRNGKKRLNFVSNPQNAIQARDRNSTDFLLVPSHMCTKDGMLIIDVLVHQTENIISIP